VYPYMTILSSYIIINDDVIVKFPPVFGVSLKLY